MAAMSDFLATEGWRSLAFGVMLGAALTMWATSYFRRPPAGPYDMMKGGK